MFQLLTDDPRNAREGVVGDVREETVGRHHLRPEFRVVPNRLQRIERIVGRLHAGRVVEVPGDPIARQAVRECGEVETREHRRGRARRWVDHLADRAGGRVASPVGQVRSSRRRGGDLVDASSVQRWVVDPGLGRDLV